MKNIRIVTLFVSVCAVLSVPASVGQPVYTDPPCADPGSGGNCNYSFFPGMPAPVNDHDFRCPDCIREYKPTDDVCQNTPGSGFTEFCGWQLLFTFPHRYQQFECNFIASAAGNNCDLQTPIGLPWDHPWKTQTVIRFVESRPCNVAGCIEEH